MRSGAQPGLASHTYSGSLGEEPSTPWGMTMVPWQESLKLFQPKTSQWIQGKGITSKRCKWDSSEKGGINLWNFSAADLPILYAWWYTKHFKVASGTAQAKSLLTFTVPADVETKQNNINHLLQRILLRDQRILRCRKKEWRQRRSWVFYWSFMHFSRGVL